MCTETNYNPTSLSLLERARGGDETAWEKQDQAAGGTDAWQQLQAQPEVTSNPQELREEMAEVYHRALQILEQDFSDNVVKAFLRFEIDNVPASEVADELGMTRDAVYAAKKRVLNRLREELSGLL